MAVLVSPFGPKPQFEDASGNPDVSYQLFFYAAGSSTKQNTYTSSTGLTANSNPIVLNSLGQPTNEIWFTQGQTYKVVLAPANDTDPPVSPIWSVDNLTGINDVSGSIDQWIASALTPTYISATSFSFVGDQTATFAIGRRLKTTNTAGTIYSTISNSVFGAVTTITIVNDSGTLDSGLSAVSYGILSSTNRSIPIINANPNYLTGVAGTNTVTGTATQVPTAYVVGQEFEFIPANTNTGATTLNISSLGAGAVQLRGAALIGGELVQNVPVKVLVSAATPVFQIIGNGAFGVPIYGSWTPADGSGAALSFTTVLGRYVKTGRMVSASYTLTYPATADGTAMKVTGLPFTAATTTSNIWGGSVNNTTFGQAIGNVVLSNTITFQVVKTDGNVPVNSAMATFIISGVITYEASS